MITVRSYKSTIPASKDVLVQNLWPSTPTERKSSRRLIKCVMMSRKKMINSFCFGRNSRSKLLVIEVMNETEFLENQCFPLFPDNTSVYTYIVFSMTIKHSCLVTHLTFYLNKWSQEILVYSGFSVTKSRTGSLVYCDKSSSSTTIIY